MVLLSTTREAAEQAIKSYDDVSTFFRMTVSLQKTKFLHAGQDVQDDERLPIGIRDASIEHVDEFPYLGSLVSSNGRIDAEIEKRIGNVCRAL